MEALLENGGHVLDHLGSPVLVSGDRALLQRGLIRLAVRRGSLPHDPTFGSELHRLKPGGNRAALESRGLALAREALAPIPEMGVRWVECSYDPATQRLTLRVGLELFTREYALEVCI